MLLGPRFACLGLAEPRRAGTLLLWHWFWDYSGGDIVNDGVHQMDVARWLVGKNYPKSVYATGGNFNP